MVQRALRAPDEATQRVYVRRALNDTPVDAFNRFVHASVPASVLDEACSLSLPWLKEMIGPNHALQSFSSVLIQRVDAGVQPVAAAAVALALDSQQYEMLNDLLVKLIESNQSAFDAFLSFVTKYILDDRSRVTQHESARHHCFFLLKLAALQAKRNSRVRLHALACLRRVSHLASSEHDILESATAAVFVCAYIVPKHSSDWRDLVYFIEQAMEMVSRYYAHPAAAEKWASWLCDSLIDVACDVLVSLYASSQHAHESLRVLGVLAQVHGLHGASHLKRCIATISVQLSSASLKHERAALLRLLELAGVQEDPDAAAECLPLGLAQTCLCGAPRELKRAHGLLETSLAAASTVTEGRRHPRHVSWLPGDAFRSSKHLSALSWIQDLPHACNIVQAQLHFMRSQRRRNMQSRSSSIAPLGVDVILHTVSFHVSLRISSGILSVYRKVFDALFLCGKIDPTATSRMLPLMLHALQIALQNGHAEHTQLICEALLPLCSQGLACEVIVKAIGKFASHKTPASDAFSVYLLSQAWTYAPHLWKRLKAAIGAVVRSSSIDTAVNLAALKAICIVCIHDSHSGRELIHEIQAFLQRASLAPCAKALTLDCITHLCNAEVLDCAMSIYHVQQHEAYATLPRLLKDGSIALLQSYIELLHSSWPDSVDSFHAEMNSEESSPRQWKLQLLTKDVPKHLWLLACCDHFDARESALQSLTDFPSDEAGYIGEVSPGTAVATVLFHVENSGLSDSNSSAEKLLRRLATDDELRLPRSKKESWRGGSLDGADCKRAYRALQVLPLKLWKQNPDNIGVSLGAASIVSRSKGKLEEIFYDALQKCECNSFESFTLLTSSLRSFFKQWIILEDKGRSSGIVTTVVRSLQTDSSARLIAASIAGASFCASMRELNGVNAQETIERCVDMLLGKIEHLAMLDTEDALTLFAIAMAVKELPLRDTPRADRFIAYVEHTMKVNALGFTAGIESLAVVSASHRRIQTKLGVMRFAFESLPLPSNRQWKREAERLMYSTDKETAIPSYTSAKDSGQFRATAFRVIGLLSASNALNSSSLAESLVVDTLECIRTEEAIMKLSLHGFCESLPSIVQNISAERLSKIDIFSHVLSVVERLGPKEQSHFAVAIGRMLHVLPAGLGSQLTLSQASHAVNFLKDTTNSAASHDRVHGIFGVSNALGAVINLTDLIAPSHISEAGSSSVLLTSPLALDSNGERLYRECLKCLERSIQQEKQTNAGALHVWSTMLACVAIRDMVRA